MFLAYTTYDKQMTIEKNGAFSSGLVTRRLHLKKKAHKTAKITAMQKLIYKCRRQIVPLAMFYFSIDSEIKTSESARKCRLFLWTFLQSVSCIEYMWYGRCGIVREQFVCTQSIWKRYSWNFEKQMRLLGYFCQLPTTLQPENNHIIVLQFFEMEAEKNL